jgi:hypothetical protein
MKAMPKFQMGILLGVPVILLTAVIAYAATNQGKYTGEFWIYGGRAGDIAPVTKTDAKIHMTVGGPLAARLFQELGPASREKGCIPDDVELRRRGDLACSRDSGEAPSCYFGFDLRSGKSTGGMTVC